MYRIKNSILFVLMFLILIAAIPADGQERRRVNTRDKARGYSVTDGDVTYQYDSQGNRRGYSVDAGDQAIDYDNRGKVRGYSQQEDGITYHQRKDGSQRGYSIDMGGESSTTKDVQDGAALSIKQDIFNYQGESGGTTGFYNPAEDAKTKEVGK